MNSDDQAEEDDERPILTTCFNCGKSFDWEPETQRWLCPACRK